MGARGPAKKPAKLHEKNGTYRPGKHGGVALPVQLPDAPPDLTPLAKAQWNIIGKKLEQAGLIADLDQTAMRLLAESCALYIEATDEIRDHGLLVKTALGNTVQNPALAIRNKLWLQILTIARQFGMTPSARTGLHIDTQQEEAGLADILGFKVVK